MEEQMLASARHLIELALAEDLDTRGDITSKAIFQNEQANASVVTKQKGVIAGLFLSKLVYDALGGEVHSEELITDGNQVEQGVVILRLTGPVQQILAGERTLLNFLGQLSGIATSANIHLAAIPGELPLLLDTRKTTPGYRLLEKYAVRTGGMQNHRMGLYDQYMIKDNHIAAAGSVTRALELVFKHRQQLGEDLPVEIEVCSLEQFREAAQLSPDIIMLDHFDADMIRAVREIPHPGIQLELSGNITADRLGELEGSGIKFVSIGAVTHSAPTFDFSMRVG
jgi:nicotinate-nucleotide pyrophosphorylase (carboxylating)